MTTPLRRARLAVPLILAVLVLTALAAARYSRALGGGAPHAAERALPEPRDASAAFAVVNATVIPMDATTGPAALAHHTVVIEGDRIVAVGPDSLVSVPAGAERIDARGRYLIPGLVDMHVHLVGETSAGDLAAYLANGVTTVRNMYGEAYHLRWRREIADGTRLGPTLYTTSPVAAGLDSPAEAVRFVRDARARGYDAVKVYPLPPAVYEALTREARDLGLPVVGHAPDHRVGLAGAARAGQRTIEHAEGILQAGTDQQHPDPADIPRLVAQLRGTGVCVVPTLVVFAHVVRLTEEHPSLSGLLARPEMRYVTPALRESWAPARNEYVTRWRGHEDELPGALAKFRRQFEWMQRLTEGLADAGVPIAAGTDASAAMVIPGFSLPAEVRLLTAAGLTPYEALSAATRTAAACLGAAAELGTVTAGKRADLVLLDRNPLEDLTALDAPAGVIVRGRWLARAELARQLGASQ